MDYEIIYTSRKTLAISVKNGRVIVRSPMGVANNTIERFIKKNRGWIDKHVEMSKNTNDPFADLSRSELENIRESARAILTSKTEKYSHIMGLKYGRITITGAKTRFGSCSSKGNISYSYRLVLYPEDAIDYVVVHELAHIKEMNHSKRFYAIIEKVLPDYKERIKLLKNHR